MAVSSRRWRTGSSLCAPGAGPRRLTCATVRGELRASLQEPLMVRRQIIGTGPSALLLLLQVMVASAAERLTFGEFAHKGHSFADERARFATSLLLPALCWRTGQFGGANRRVVLRRRGVDFSSARYSSSLRSPRSTSNAASQNAYRECPHQYDQLGGVQDL
ncbi:MAG: hypothetical protein JWL62_3890 [Hyphomicrobiales bacterium]|nr:hypothetical protein [Hyphomicrobiales bacterium]